MRRRAWVSSVTALAMVGAVSGCGAGRGSSVSGSTSGLVTSATPHTVPVAPGMVSVVLEADHYPVGAVIRASVANGLDRVVYTEDHKTNCSIAVLQRRDGDTWTDITGCRLGRPTVTVAIGPGLGPAVEIDPSGFQLTNQTGGPALGAGSYRVRFTYRLEPGMSGEQPLAADSPEFAIR